MEPEMFFASLYIHQIKVVGFNAIHITCHMPLLYDKLFMRKTEVQFAVHTNRREAKLNSTNYK